jgi:hypothetical protein
VSRILFADGLDFSKWVSLARNLRKLLSCRRQIVCRLGVICQADLSSQSPGLLFDVSVKAVSN